MARTSAFLSGSLSEFVKAPLEAPKTALKWCFPPLICFLGFCFQSAMLHMTTAKYVDLHFPDDLLNEETKVIPDVGHVLLGRGDLEMEALDLISVSALPLFMMGCLLLRDLRLWAKLFFSNCTLFVLKGLFDWITVFPDSIGMQQCAERLGPGVAAHMKNLNHLHGMGYMEALLKLEVLGFPGPPKKWPVRYCADMLVSGHTFVVLLYLLGLADLVRQVSLLYSPSTRQMIRIAIGLFAFVCVGVDVFCIIYKHFHYTVDCALSIAFTFLIYTNAGMAILVQAYVSGDRARSQEGGMIWIPQAMVPFCCFSGYYAVSEMDEEEVVERQAANQSALWKRLAPEQEVLRPLEAPSYESARDVP